ncbi:MAG: hypothetical protein H6816_00070 [Phycisphaerales bacterium]|nr:hypothetical protein [Phycisphaerales bacterium]
MAKQKGMEAWVLATCTAFALLCCVGQSAHAQFFEEDFDGVTASGEGENFFSGSGFQLNNNWDSGITGENAFAGTVLNARFGSVSARGTTTGGVDGTGAGELEVAGVSFAALFEEFNNATFTGGNDFATNGATTGYTQNWDNGIDGETAFFGVKGSAVVGASGAASASVNPLAGNPGAAAQVAVNGVTLNGGNWFAGLTIPAQPLQGANPLYNAGFDDNGGSLDNWPQFGGNNFSVTDGPTALSGAAVYKSYGMFNSPDNVSGVYQDLRGEEGQVWQLGISIRNDTIVNGGLDDITGANPNQFIIKIEFRSATDVLLDDVEMIALDNMTPTNQWIERNLISNPAPANTAVARIVLLFRNVNYAGGAAFADNVTVGVLSGPPQADVDLSQIEFMADVKGETNGAGSTLGAYQLRLEDANGNRLAFLETANGGFQSVGGALSTAIEYGADDMTTTGAFDVNSPSMTAVLVFDPDSAPAWGTGGLLTLDNLVLTNDDTTGSGWYAGMFFDGIDINSNAALDLSRISLTANVKGDVPGGDYLMRVEGNTITQAGLDDGFETATGTGGGLFLTTNGPDYQYIATWDDGISNSGAFAGFTPGTGLCESFPPFFTCDTNGFIARAKLSGGNPGAYAQLKAQNISYDPGETWYMGMTFPEQGVASTDLSTVFLYADIRGKGVDGGPVGTYELRIEDAQGDRLYVTGQASTSWTTVGGALSTFTEDAAAGGGGDGTFDLDSSSYTVVVATGADAEQHWENGGILEIDNVYLTPVDVLNQIGTVTFDGTADGSFQKIGGILTAGTSTFSPNNFEEDFSSGTGTGGGVFVNSNGNVGLVGWDDGLTGESMFFGGYGTGNVVGPNTTAAAQVCPTCGVSGTQAGQIIISNAVLTGSNTWYAGLSWGGLHLNFNQIDPADVTMTAKIKGEVNGAGSTLGMYTLRIEDPNLDFLAFDVPAANGTFQTVGGPLSTAVEGGTGDGAAGSDFVFNYQAGTYAFALVFLGGQDGTWGTGAKFTIDDLFLTLKGFRFADAETYTVTIAFRNELDTWGTSGKLVVDNVTLTPAANSDGDLDVDLVDFAQFQACFGLTPADPGCSSDDLNGDNVIDLADFSVFEKAFCGPM